MVKVTKQGASKELLRWHSEFEQCLGEDVRPSEAARLRANAMSEIHAIFEGYMAIASTMACGRPEH